MRDVLISVAPMLDKKNGTKNVKVVFITTAKDDGFVKTNREEISSEIIRNEVKNTDEILKWIEKYKKDRDKVMLK